MWMALGVATTKVLTMSSVTWDEVEGIEALDTKRMGVVGIL